MYGFAFIKSPGARIAVINELFEGFLVATPPSCAWGMLIGAYGLIAFVVVPVFADSLYFRHLKKRLASARDQYENGTTYGPSKWTEVGAAGFGIVWVLGLFLLPSYVGYTPRVKISKAIVIAGAMKTEVAEFYHSEKRLPTSEEAKKFRNEPEHSVARHKVADLRRQCTDGRYYDARRHSRASSLPCMWRFEIALWSGHAARSISMRSTCLPRAGTEAVHSLGKSQRKIATAMQMRKTKHEHGVSADKSAEWLSREECVRLLTVALFAWLVVISEAVSAPKSIRVARSVSSFRSPRRASGCAGKSVVTTAGASVGQPIVVDNRAGASGIIGFDIVAKAAPMATHSRALRLRFAVNPAIYKKLPYDTERDFVSITNYVNGLGYLLVAHPSLPARSLKELIALARNKPLTYSSAGIGNGQHLAGELFNIKAGIQLLHVPYKGGAPAAQRRSRWRSPSPYASADRWIAARQVGRLRALGFTGAKRLTFLPEVPTIGESSLPGYVYDTIWHAWFAPAKHPPRS